MKKIFVVFIFCLLFFSGFAAPGKEKYMKSMTFNRGMVYYVIPYDYTSSDKNVNVSPDFTYALYKDSVNPYVVMNFSVFQKEGIRKFNRVEIVTGDSVIFRTDSLERFYSEPSDKIWENRFSTNIKLADLINFLRTPNQTIVFYYDEKKISIKVPSNKRKGMAKSAMVLQISCADKY